jgi:geranylgeranyl diphosphate synthase type 3
MELFWRDTGKPPTEEEYLTMVSNKTGGLLRLAVRLMQNESKNTTYVKHPVCGKS